MKKGLMLFVIVSAAALLMSGCAAKEEMAAHGDTKGESITLGAGDFFEVCDMEKNWRPGNRISVEFTSSAPVVFDVHYHEAHEKKFAIGQAVTADFDGDFVVQSGDIHCGMWKNDTGKPVTLTYNIDVE